MIRVCGRFNGDTRGSIQMVIDDQAKSANLKRASQLIDGIGYADLLTVSSDWNVGYFAWVLQRWSRDFGGADHLDVARKGSEEEVPYVRGQLRSPCV